MNSAKLQDQALANAACIGNAFGARMGGSFLIENIEEIAQAAQALAAFESAPGFDWEREGAMWEEVCTWIAERIGEEHGLATVQHWHEVIRLHLKAARTAQLRRGRK